MRWFFCLSGNWFSGTGKLGRQTAFCLWHVWISDFDCVYFVPQLKRHVSELQCECLVSRLESMFRTKLMQKQLLCMHWRFISSCSYHVSKVCLDYIMKHMSL